MLTLPKSLCAAAALVFVSAPFAAAAADIAELAPRRSFVVLGVRNWTEAGEQLGASELGALWREPGVRAFVGHLSEEPLKEFSEGLKEANLSLEDLAPPTGHVGAAMFFAPADSPRRQDGDDAPDVLIVAEFGENAQAMREAVERLLETGLDKGRIETETDEYQGVTITKITPVPQEEPEDAAAEGMDEEEDWEDFEDEPAEDLLGGDRPVYLAEVDGTFVLSSDLTALEGAIDGLSGRQVEAVADHDMFVRALAQHPEDAAAYAVLLAEPLWQLLDAGADAEEMGMNPLTMFGALGVTDIRAMGFALRVGGEAGSLEQTFGLLIPEKRGLVSLFGHPAGAFAPPAFVGPDVMTAGVFTFDFARVLDVARSFIEQLPEEQRAQAAVGLEQMSPIVQPGLEVMGPGVYIASSLRRPLEADSELQFWAVQVRDELIVSNLLSYGATASGLFTPRDFNGNVIYSSDMVPMAAGLGFGHLFFGATAAVENAMRSAGAPDGPQLATEPEFARAIDVLGNDGVAYSYADMRQTLQWMYWQWENARSLQEQQLDEWGLEPEHKAEFMRMFDEHQPKWLSHLPPLDELTRHLGDVVSEIRPTDDGFRGRTIWRRPAE